MLEHEFYINSGSKQGLDIKKTSEKVQYFIGCIYCIPQYFIIVKSNYIIIYHNNQCTENNEEFRILHSLILTTRIMYMELRITYFQHHQDFNKDSKELQSHIFEELQEFIHDLNIIKKIVTDVLPYFYITSSLPSTFVKGNIIIIYSLYLFLFNFEYTFQ